MSRTLGVLQMVGAVALVANALATDDVLAPVNGDFPIVNVHSVIGDSNYLAFVAARHTESRHANGEHD
jgi:hypothetical protein